MKIAHTITASGRIPEDNWKRKLWRKQEAMGSIQRDLFRISDRLASGVSPDVAAELRKLYRELQMELQEWKQKNIYTEWQ